MDLALAAFVLPLPWLLVTAHHRPDALAFRLAPARWDVLTFALLVYPLLEEWLLRVVVLTWTERRLARAWPRNVATAAAVVVSALAFVLVHVPRMGPSALLVAAPGLVLAALYARHRRLWDVVALHAWWNLLALLFQGNSSIPS